MAAPLIDAFNWGQINFVNLDLTPFIR
jgi:hypothetical protein